MKLFTLIVAAVLFCVTALPVKADMDVLLVGVSQYKDKELAVLGLQQDFIKFEAAIRAAGANNVVQKLGAFSRKDILGLFDLDVVVSENTSKIQGNTKSNRFPIDKKKRGDQLLILVAGHGLMNSNDYYLISSDYTKTGDPVSNQYLVPVDLLRRRATEFGYDKVCVLTDICLSRFEIQPYPPYSIQDDSMTQSFILSGTREGQPAIELKSGGLFTQSVINAIKAFKDEKHTLTLERLESDTWQQMMRIGQEPKLVSHGQPWKYILVEGTEKPHEPKATPNLNAFVKSFIDIPSGSFNMGSGQGKTNELPVHKVLLSQFRMSSKPITVALWKEYCDDTGTPMPSAPSWGWIDSHPIVNVSWLDIMGRDGKGASSRDGFCGWVYRRSQFALTLPTEAQFEFATRLRNPKTMFPWGDMFDSEKAWNSRLRTGDAVSTADVHRDKNVFSILGLIDMIGNVRQWCRDWYGDFTDVDQLDPVGPNGSTKGRVVRGNSWRGVHPKDSFTSTVRDNELPTQAADDLGFRLVDNMSQESVADRGVQINLQGLPANSQATINGTKVVGGTYIDIIKTAEKTVRLDVRAKGYEAYSSDVKLVAGQTQTIIVRMVRLPRLDEFPITRKYIESLREIKEGRFVMGSDRNGESPAHTVTLSTFRMGATPVTVAMWREYCADNGINMPPAPKWGWFDKHPVVNVSWNDIMNGPDGKGGFCAWVSEVAGFTLTLPSEAQFEYAARAGQKGDVYQWGKDFDVYKVQSKAWAGDTTINVDRDYRVYKNKYGLTDMVGNVFQWCSDVFGPFVKTLEVDPTGPSSLSSSQRVIRGASFMARKDFDLRCARRNGQPKDEHYYDVGFRLMAPVVQK